MVQSSLTAWLIKPAPVQTNVVPARTVVRQTDVSTPLSSNKGKYEDLSETRTVTHRLRDAKSSAPERALISNVQIRPCLKEDIKSMKHLISLLLPIPYTEKFYREIIEDEITSNITLVAVWHDDVSLKGKEKGRLIGAVRCRLLLDSSAPTQAPKGGGPMLYLSTLVLLSPYRTHGIAAHMLDILIQRAISDYGVSRVGAHVWEVNEEGLCWYRKRGFVEVGREKDYYKRLNPMGAIIMERKIGVTDLVRIEPLP